MAVQESNEKEIKCEANQTTKDIAIVGISCRFPDADNYNEFWKNLEGGVDSIREITPDRWDIDKYYSKDIKKSNKSISKWCGLISNIDKFDDRFFNISPREARSMDPQQRLLLEETWHCIEDSCVHPERLRKMKTSVHVGVMAIDYHQQMVSPEIDTDSYACLGNYGCILANRVSYAFGLKGASTSIEAACSSSLVAIHDAKCSLERGESDYGVVAGVSLNLHPWKYVSFSKSRMLSPDGRCKTFDKDANGYVPGDGVGILLLQRLGDAVKEGNIIYGVIKGSAVNHTGRSLSITAPTIDAQLNVILSSYKNAGLNPETVGYVEAHGTGTSLGDPIEVEALTRAFKVYTEKKGFCKIGSVKTNIGHLEAAAGVAGVIKVLMMMQHQKIPPTLNLKVLNPLIQFQNSPFRPALGTSDWRPAQQELPLRAGISSFGFGGTNSHVILESFSKNRKNMKIKGSSEKDRFMFILSAKSSGSLDKMIETWRIFIKSENFEKYQLEDICTTLIHGREYFRFRYGSIIRDKNQLREFLKKPVSSYLNQKGQTWCMRIGGLLCDGFAKLHPLECNHTLFKKHLMVIEKQLGDNSQFRCDLWPMEVRPLYSFVAGYAYVLTIIEIGFTPDLIMFEKSGLWIALVLSNVISLQNALLILSNQKDLSEIIPVRPDKSLFDPVSQSTITPFKFSETYVRELVQDFGEISNNFLNKARILSETQFTFIKYLKEWNKVLKKWGKDCKQLLNNDDLWKSNYNKIKKDKILIAVIIISSLWKLNQKWELAETFPVKKAIFKELVSLVNQEVLPANMFVELLVSDEPDYAEIAKTLNMRQKKMDKASTWKYLKQHERTPQEFNNFSCWVEKVSGNISMPSYEDSTFLTFETIPVQDGRHIAAKSETYLTDIREIALKLWLEGINIDLKKFDVTKTWNKVALPGYYFEKNSYWQNGSKITKNKGDIRSSNLKIEHVDLKKLKFEHRFSIEDRIIADHIITGKAIVPAACMVELGVETVRKIEAQPIGRLRNIYFKEPGIVKGNLSCEINIIPSENRFMIQSENRVLCSGEYTSKCGKLFPPMDMPMAIKENVTDLYALLPSHGYRYGNSLQVIENVFRKQDAFIFKLRNPAGERNSEVDPALLDGFFQCILMAELLEEKFLMAEGIYIPFHIRTLKIFNKISEHCMVYIYKHDIKRKSGDLKASLRVYDNSGKGILEIIEMTFKRVSKQFLNQLPYVGTSSKDIKKAYYYAPLWEEQPLKITDHDDFSQCAIVFAGESDFSRLLIQQLTDKYRKIFIVKKGRTVFEKQNELFTIDAQSGHSYQNVLREIVKMVDFDDFDIYHLWAYECQPNPVTNNQMPMKMQKDSVKSIFHLTRSFIEIGFKGFIRIVVAVRDVHVVMPRDKGKEYIHGGLSGLARTIMIENTKIKVKIIDFKDKCISDDEKGRLLFQEIRTYGKNDTIAYRDRKRLVRLIKHIDVKIYDKNILRNDTVYLIVGGAGGIGLHIANLIVSKVRCHLVLMGRSEPSLEKRKQIENLNNFGSKIHYIIADITDYNQTEQAIRKINHDLGALNGVIQAGGILDDKLIAHKDWNVFQHVLKPKIAGTWNINQLTQTQPLDFFVVFSSVTSIWGNAGQADYAAANGFMDAFIHYRAKQHYPGKSMGINWTLWSDGGMGTKASVIKSFSRKTGVIGSHVGTLAFEQLLASDHCQAIVTGRNLEKNKKTKKLESSAAFEKKMDADQVQEKEINNEFEKNLLELLSEVLEIDRKELANDTDLKEYGLESIGLADYAERINAKFKIDINATLLYEYSTIEEITTYLVNQYHNEIREFHNLEKRSVKTSSTNKIQAIDCPMAANENSNFTIFSPVNEINRSLPDKSDINIAIVGISGRFPGSNDIDIFWNNLIEGRDLITEIPKDRWSWEKTLGDPKHEKNKSITKFGGFLEDMKMFDAQFFRISPREAEMMDPQQRLLMQEVWHLIEDAGYRPSSLSNTNTGVFIGVCNSDYSELMLENNVKLDANTSTGTYFSIVPNRISYFFNLNGPSIAIDTACSSSLVAVHLAVKAIQSQECKMAIAGGVNICCMPRRYISFSHAGMLSKDGKCKTFDESADGYVRGEGLGVILMKSLEDALLDRDYIYGVIKATAVNHGGFANTLTAPNTNAQCNLLIDAYQQAGIDPCTVGYIEAHGTGTSLGDPIEINALKKAFEKLYKKCGKSITFEPHCGLGSVKSNIGHLETAAGIAGLIKVLLSMKHKKLPPSIHCNELNPLIQLNGTPFYIVKKASKWKKVMDENMMPFPRRAGVSSFGFGGANAHVVIEEYENPIIKLISPENQSYLFILSAKNRERLREYAAIMADFIEEQKVGRSAKEMQNLIYNIIYTLKIYREPMDERLAIVVTSPDELIHKLIAFCIKKNNEDDKMYYGNVRKQNLSKKELNREKLLVYIRSKNLKRLAKMWVSGEDIDWAELYEGSRPYRMSIPKYPFKKESYWISKDGMDCRYSVDEKKSEIEKNLLVDLSRLKDTGFSIQLSGDDYFLKDHVVDGKKILPGVAYLEMACSAGKALKNKNIEKIINITWASPIIVNGATKEIELKLNSKLNGSDFKVISVNSGKELLHANGKIIFEKEDAANAKKDFIDINAIRNRCVDVKDNTSCYELFKTRGFNYGDGFKTIQKVDFNEIEALSVIELPTNLKKDFLRYTLHPSLMDAALQTTIILMDNSSDIYFYLPYMIEEVKIMRPLTNKCYAYANKKDNRSYKTKSFDILVLNESKQVVLKMINFIVKGNEINRRIDTNDKQE